MLEWHRYVDTVIECIDLTTNRVVASTRIDEALVRFIGPGLVWFFREESSGIDRLEVVRLRLDSGSRTSPP